MQIGVGGWGAGGRAGGGEGGETILVQEGLDMPVAIVRPSIVTAAWQEPLPVSADKGMGVGGGGEGGRGGGDDPRPGGTGHAGRHRPAVHRHRRLAGAAARECR